MKKNIAIAVLSVVCLVLLGLEAKRFLARRVVRTAHEDEARERTRRVLAGLEARMAEVLGKLRERDEELAKLRSAIGKLDVPDPHVEVMPSAAPRPPVRAEDEATEAAPEPLAGLGEQIAGMLQNTNLLQSLIAQGMGSARVAQTMEQEYSDFFRGLGLNDEQVAAALAMMKKRSRLAVLSNLDVLSTEGGDTPQVYVDGEPVDAEGLEREMRELLGDDGYETFQRFDETRAARRTVNGFEDFLRNKDLSLDDDQRGRLVDMFHATGAAHDGNELGGGLTFSMGASEGGAADESIENSLDNLVVKYDQLAKDAESVLDDEQSNQFRDYLDAQLQRKEMEGDIARRLLPALNLEGIDGLPVQGSVQVIAAPPVVVEE